MLLLGETSMFTEVKMIMYLIDTHCHLNLPNYQLDADTVIRRAQDNQIGMIVVGTDYKSSRRALDLVNRFENGVYAAIGLHPGELEDHEEEYGGQKIMISGEKYNSESYQLLAKFPKVVAIGEIGLDYFQRSLDYELREEVKQRQRKVLEAQLELAVVADLPIILHCRQAHEDLLKMLASFKKKFRDALPEDRPWGVVHCFSGDETLAWQYFNLGLVISFTGLITFSQQWDILIRKMPLEKLLLETDSPFLTPEPYRGKRNEPILVKQVAERIALIKGVPVDRIAEVTTANARQLFKII